jgi:hypothetical protein
MSVGRRMKTLVLLTVFAGSPSAAFAQAAIAGTVRDPSDAALAGVLVEASGPALIEKTRAAITDTSDVKNAFVPGGTWLQPQTILTPRFFRLTAEIAF